MQLRDIALACCPPALWALSYALAKPALEHFPPIFMTSLAYAAAALILLFRSLRAKTPWPAMVAIAALGGALQSILIFTGLTGLPVSTAILIVQSQVPFAVLSAWAICGEKVNVRRLAGMAIVLAGIGLIAGAPEAVHAFGSLALVVLGTLSWGVAQALIRARGRDDASTIIGSVTLYATPQLALASLVLESGQLKALRTATLLDWSAVLTLAVGGFVVSYSIWYGLMRRYRVDQVTPFALLMPLAGVVFGAVLFGERLSTRALVGGLVVLSGLAFILKESTAGRKPSTAEI
jgi:O-acetylserine/cysteine efflux transporter